MIRAIIFDFFGVLAGSGFKEIYRQAGGDLDQDSDFLDNVLGAASRGVISPLEMNQQVADRIGMTYEDWHDTIQKGEAPNPELLDYIRNLKKKYKVAILSNANHGSLQKLLTKDQLSIFDEIVVSADIGMIKPHAEIYELTADRLGVSPQECVFTDDSQDHCEGARATGMQAILYQNFAQFTADLRKITDTL